MDRFKSVDSKKIIQIGIIVTLSLLAFVSILQGVRNAVEYSQDFQWDATRALIERIDPYELSLQPQKEVKSDRLSDFYRLFTDKGLKQKMEANQFPSLLALLAPYAFISPFVARVLWLISNLIFTIGIIYLLRQTFLKDMTGASFTIVAVLMLAGTPYRNQLGVGQHTLFSFFFFLMAVWLDEKKPDGNGILIAICMAISYFKYTLTAPLTLYMLYKKRFKEFAASIGIHIVLTILSAIWLQKDIIYMIKAPLQVSAALSAEGGIDLGAIFSGSSVAFLLGGVIALVLTGVTFRLGKGCEHALFAMLILWSLVLTYHRTYDFFVLSAIPVLIDENIKEKIVSEKISKLLNVFYIVVVISVYFGLRIFNENTLSKIIVGTLYYAFTLVITAIVIGYTYMENKKIGNAE